MWYDLVGLGIVGLIVMLAFGYVSLQLGYLIHQSVYRWLAARKAKPVKIDVTCDTTRVDTSLADTRALLASLLNKRVPRRVVKVGRNAPCPCGATKSMPIVEAVQRRVKRDKLESVHSVVVPIKYKHCCGKDK